MVNQSSIGRPPVMIRMEVVSAPGAVVEVAQFTVEGIKPITRTRIVPMNLWKKIWRMINQVVNQVFHRKKCSPTPTLPAPTVVVSPHNLDPSITVNPNGERDGNIIELYRGTLSDMSDQVKLTEFTVAAIMPSYHDNLTAGTYYYRARERTADSSVIGAYSAIVSYVATA